MNNSDINLLILKGWLVSTYFYFYNNRVKQPFAGIHLSLDKISLTDLKEWSPVQEMVSYNRRLMEEAYEQ